MSLYDYAQVQWKWRRRRQRRRIIYFTVFIIFLILLLINELFRLYFLHSVNSCGFQKALSMESVAKVTLFYRNLNEARGVLALYRQDYEKATFYLSKAKPILKGEKIIDCFYRKGDNRSTLVYGKFLFERGYATPEYAAVLFCAGKEKEARAVFPSVKGDKKKKQALKLVLERNLKGTVAGDLSPLDLGPFEIKDQFINVSTIIPWLQKKLKSLMRKIRGGALLLSPKGEILAFYFSSPAIYKKAYELGSVFKLLSATLILKSGKDLFPYQCRGWERVGKKVVYDWMRHGTIRNLEEAIAESCNSLFASYGKDFRPEEIRRMLEKFRLLEGIRIGGEEVPPGEVYSGSDPYRLARLSAGLQGGRFTIFHAAQIALVFANRGVLYRPFLIKEKRNCLLKPVWRKEVKGVRIIEEGEAEKIAKGMLKAVEKGTGRKAKMDWTEVALKTGSTGKKPFDAWVVGFVPYERPKLIFVLFMPSSGRADIVAVPVVKKLLEGVKNYILFD